MNKTLTVTSSEQVWQSADKTRTIWKVQTSEGVFETFSEKIAFTKGSVDVEIYDRNDKKFIRGQKKEGFGGKGGGGFDLVGVEVGHAINCACMIMSQDPSPNILDIEDWATKILALGDKMKAERKNQPPPQQQLPWNNDKGAVEICIDAGLGQRINQAGMPESHIEQVYEDVGRQSAKLVVEIGKQLESAGY